MAPRAWPAALAAAWSGYAAALARLPGAAADAEALRRECVAEPVNAWQAARAVAAWAKFRPHALLARKSRPARGGALNRLIGGPVAVWAAPDALLLARLDHLAGLACAVETALTNLAVTDTAARLGRLGESIDPWPPTPEPSPDDWPGLRDHLFAVVTGPARAALAFRLLPDDDFGTRFHAEGPSPELRYWHRVALDAEPGLRPRVDALTLRPVETPEPGDATVAVASPEPAGGVVGVAQFATPPGRPTWQVSSGPTAPTTQYPTATATGWVWPPGTPLTQPGLRGVFHAETLGTVVAAERVSNDPAAACFTVSLGPVPSAASAAYDLVALSAEPAWRAALAPPLDAVWSGVTLDAAWLSAVLDAVTLPDSPVSAATAEPALARLAEWCGATLIGAAGYDRAADEAVTGVRAVPVFRKAEPVGALVRVRSFGLVAGGTVVRPAEVVVSAGALPPGCADLEALLPAVPEAVRGELKSALAGLRPAGLHGYLELAAVELFQLYWGRVRPAWHAADPEGAEGFAHALTHLLDGPFGVRPFAPGNVFDHPDGWVTLPPGCRVTSGRVVELLAPGLLDAAGGLRLPAHAVAE